MTYHDAMDALTGFCRLAGDDAVCRGQLRNRQNHAYTQDGMTAKATVPLAISSMMSVINTGRSKRPGSLGCIEGYKSRWFLRCALALLEQATRMSGPWFRWW